MLWFKKRDQYKFNATGLTALGYHMAETGEPQFQKNWVMADRENSLNFTVGTVARLSAFALILGYMIVRFGVLDACMNLLHSLT